MASGGVAAGGAPVAGHLSSESPPPVSLRPLRVHPPHLISPTRHSTQHKVASDVSHSFVAAEIAVLGSRGVGKTSFIEHLVGRELSAVYSREIPVRPICVDFACDLEVVSSENYGTLSTTAHISAACSHRGHSNDRGNRSHQSWRILDRG